ncbi:MAG: hypothetical protein NT150_00970 [Bacteroidetes bacterium]|nr:hypothetical protein [Bacteroidota bacterium]
MKKVLVIVVVSALVIIAVTGFVKSCSSDIGSGFEPTYGIKKIHSDTLNADIYIKKKNWGVSGDHQVVVISTSGQEKFEPDSTKDYIFVSEFFFKASKDSLYIYTDSKAKEPRLFDSKFKVIQVELSNPKMMDLRGYDNFKNKGLELSTYIDAPADKK